jgi:hypothetical protein
MLGSAAATRELEQLSPSPNRSWVGRAEPTQAQIFRMTTSSGPWSAEHFSQANPEGPGQDDLPALLRRVADSLEGYAPIDVVLDLVLHSEVNEHGNLYSITAYFRRPPAQLAPPIPLRDVN